MCVGGGPFDRDPTANAERAGSRNVLAWLCRADGRLPGADVCGGPDFTRVRVALYRQSLYRDRDVGRVPRHVEARYSVRGARTHSGADRGIGGLGRMGAD